MEKLNFRSGELRVASGEWMVQKKAGTLRSSLSVLRSPFSVILCFILHSSFFSSAAVAQVTAGDSIVGKLQRSMDSVMKADSIERTLELAQARQFIRTRQLATQRTMDMKGDGKTEILRLTGVVPKEDVGKTKLTFTIKLGKKTLFEDSWLAEGYFDTIDHLQDSIKLKRLSTIVTVFFSNDNFGTVDSNDYREMMKRVTKDEIEPNSAEARELFHKPRMMYSVFHSRDYWYGLIWDPKKEKFIKAWRN